MVYSVIVDGELLLNGVNILANYNGGNEICIIG